MRDIAQQAGVALGAVYYYFDSKDALVMAFYERTQMELAPLAEAALSKTQNLEERLRALLTVKFDYFAPIVPPCLEPFPLTLIRNILCRHLTSQAAPFATTTSACLPALSRDRRPACPMI